MECRVISPSGRVIPSHVVNTDRGMKVKYTPEEPGVYYVHTYIGGVEIPGASLSYTKQFDMKTLNLHFFHLYHF